MIEAVDALPVAIVQHANQFLIANGYEEREGIAELADAYTALLVLHQERGVPLNLHISGTLIEALSWFAPRLVELIRDMVESGIVALIGSAYAQPVMPLFAADLNVRQLTEHLRLYETHFGVDPESIEVCWIPERVWNTDALAPALTSKQISNGGYRWVLLDDRVLFDPETTDGTSPRARFDESCSYLGGDSSGVDSLGWTASLDPYRIWGIQNGHGLGVVPMSSAMRYWSPPATVEHEQSIEKLATFLVEHRDKRTILVAADDIEKSAGVAAWNLRNPAEYVRFLDWARDSSTVTPVRLDEWLEDQDPLADRLTLAPGTFRELAHDWEAGEDYLGWWHSPEWAPFRASLGAAETAVRALKRDHPDNRLVDAAWKHLMASTYETAWHDPVVGRPAPWAQAVASHSRACDVIATAARWFEDDNDHARVVTTDVDGDGVDEILIGNDRLLAVVSPQHGGRITWMFGRTSVGDAILVGNPTDDWNWQTDMNRSMDRPANHPGALCDVGFEHDVWMVRRIDTVESGVVVELENTEADSLLHGAQRTLHLSHHAESLDVCIYNPRGVVRLGLDLCLSPDYPTLLREGRAAVRMVDEDDCRGATCGSVSALVAIDAEEPTSWAATGSDVGHGITIRVRSNVPHYHLRIGSAVSAHRSWCDDAGSVTATGA